MSSHQLPTVFAQILNALYTTRDPRLLATIRAAQESGWSNTVIGQACGVSSSRISQLRDLPTLGYGPVPDVPTAPGKEAPELPQADGNGRPLLMDVETAVAELDLSPVTIKSYLRTGKLAGIKDGRSWIVLRPAAGPQSAPEPEPTGLTYKSALEQVHARAGELLKATPAGEEAQSQAALELIRLATEVWHAIAAPAPERKAAEFPGDGDFRAAIEARLETSPDPAEAASIAAEYDDEIWGDRPPYWTQVVDWVRLRRAFHARYGVTLRAWTTGHGGDVHIRTDTDFTAQIQGGRTLTRHAGDMLDETKSTYRKTRDGFRPADDRLPNCYQCNVIVRRALPDVDHTPFSMQPAESGWDWDAES
ncbi:hypothetical protein [Streptomyces sp. NPDC089799]|uniref:helix-turn-helix domain-containing protein n=1 Tax=Streptomyces sp. NPDC089799 TaxID=3155066 RepID=UPI003436E99B